MSTPPPAATPVKLFAAVLHGPGAPLEPCLEALGAAFSPLDFRGAPHPFTCTDYYAAEMGPDLARCLVGFERLADPAGLVAAKHAAAAVEARFAVGGRRTVNVDPGYLDLFKVVLASFKERGNKVYLGQGVWADVTLTWRRGGFVPLPWSFPDFRAGTYDAELTRLRARYREQLREAAAP